MLTEAPKPMSLPAPGWVRAQKNTKTSIKLWWKRVPGAAGYRVYRRDAKERSYVRVKTLTGGSVTSWVDRKRTTGKEYRYVIQPFRVQAGERFGGSKSKWVSAVAYKKNARTVNAGRIDFPNVTVSVMGRITLVKEAKLSEGSASLIAPSKYSKAKGKKVINYTLRETVVSGQGFLQAIESTQGRVTYSPKRPGDVRVQMVAHDGVRKFYTIHVEDYSRPKRLLYEQFQAGSAARLLLEKHASQLGEIGHVTQDLALTGSWPHIARYTLHDDGSLGCDDPTLTIETMGSWEPHGVPSECGATMPKQLTAALDTLIAGFKYPLAVSVNGKTGVVVVEIYRTADMTDVPALVMFNPRDTDPPHPPRDGQPTTVYWLARCWMLRL